MSRKHAVSNFVIVLALLLLFTTVVILHQINQTLFIHTTTPQTLPNEVYDDISTNQRTVQPQAHMASNQSDNKMSKKKKRKTEEYELNEIIYLRTHPITKKCANPHRVGPVPKYSTLNMSALPLNIVPFLNRCQLNKSIFTRNHAEWHEMFITTKLGYIHNYKVAGTTIQESLHRLSKNNYLENAQYVFNQTGDIMRWCLKFLNHTKYWQNKDKWYSLMSDIFLFTLVRNPIDRLLSSYFEINTRQLHVFKKNNIQHLRGMNKFRSLLQIFSSNTEKYLLNDFMSKHVNKRNRMNWFKMKKLWSGEAHLHPQILHLLNLDLKYFPFSYIGDLKYFDDILLPILREFVPYLLKEPRFYRGAIKTYRNRESSWYYGENVNGDFNIKRDNLTDDDIKMICEIYWIDYICLPFDMPKQCNITDLLVKHYAKHVTYNDCYFS